MKNSLTPSYKAWLGTVLFVVLSRLMFAATPEQPASAPSDPIVMTVDGEAVSAAEYTLVMEGRVAEVAGYFHGQGVDDHLGYWTDDGKGDNPIKMLRKVVTEELTRIKTIQGWAKQKGLITDTSYAVFHQGLLAENARRQKAVENKQVIYGPTQYKAYRYYFFKLSDLNQALLASVTKEPDYAVPAADIETFYKDNRDAFGARGLEDVRAQIVGIFQKKKYEARLKERIAQAKVQVDTVVLNTIAPRHDP